MGHGILACGQSNALCHSSPGCAVASSGMPITMPLVVIVSFFSVIHCSSSLSPLPSNHGYIRISCVIIAVCLDSFVLNLYMICYQAGL